MTDAVGDGRVRISAMISAVPMNAAVPMNSLTMQRCLVGAMRSTHDLAQLQSVIVRNLAPAFARLELPYDRVEALTRGISQ